MGQSLKKGVSVLETIAASGVIRIFHNYTEKFRKNRISAKKAFPVH
jgi:hypothetical protein